MQKLIIRNSEWLRGYQVTPSDMRPGFMEWNPQLLELEGSRYDVQGLYCRLLGVQDSHIRGHWAVAHARRIDKDLKKELKWLFSRRYACGVSRVAQKIMDINYDYATTDAQKIEQLKPIFAAHGVEIEYRDDE